MRGTTLPSRLSCMLRKSTFMSSKAKASLALVREVQRTATRTCANNSLALNGLETSSAPSSKSTIVSDSNKVPNTMIGISPVPHSSTVDADPERLQRGERREATQGQRPHSPHPATSYLSTREVVAAIVGQIDPPRSPGLAARCASLGPQPAYSAWNSNADLLSGRVSRAPGVGSSGHCRNHC